jgi:hypothetical protein
MAPLSGQAVVTTAGADPTLFLLISGSKVRILVRPPLKSKTYAKSHQAGFRKVGTDSERQGLA